MAITAPGLFGWQEVNDQSDLKRLELVLKNGPDEELMRHCKYSVNPLSLVAAGFSLRNLKVAATPKRRVPLRT